MRQSTVARFGTAVILLSSLSYSASADVTPTPMPLTQMEQYKKDREIFKAAVRERNQKIQMINQIFNSAIKKARQDSKIAMQSAVKPDQKSAIYSNLKSVIASAVIERESAMEALGEAPTAPVEPTKMQRGSQNAKGGGEKNRR
jgi:hypothetical protein